MSTESARSCAARTRPWRSSGGPGHADVKPTHPSATRYGDAIVTESRSLRDVGDTPGRDNVCIQSSDRKLPHSDSGCGWEERRRSLGLRGIACATDARLPVADVVGRRESAMRLSSQQRNGTSPRVRNEPPQAHELVRPTLSIVSQVRRSEPYLFDRAPIGHSSSRRDVAIGPTRCVDRVPASSTERVRRNLIATSPPLLRDTTG
jgi:hypothetical protein